MECPECGRDVSKSARSCPHCGHTIDAGLVGAVIFLAAVLLSLGAVVWGVLVHFRMA